MYASNPGCCIIMFFSTSDKVYFPDIGKLINADINGAIGIGRKVFGDSYVSKIIDSGLAFNPVRVNIL